MPEVWDLVGMLACGRVNHFKRLGRRRPGGSDVAAMREVVGAGGPTGGADGPTRASVVTGAQNLQHRTVS